jgi:hypothetical protein
VPDRSGATTPGAASSRSAIDGKASNGAGAGPPAAVPPTGQVKPGRHREATLYHALAGAGAGNGRTLAQLREAALEEYEISELPVWRRSGFWTTTLQKLDLDSLRVKPDPSAAGVVPEVVRPVA